MIGPKEQLIITGLNIADIKKKENKRARLIPVCHPAILPAQNMIILIPPCFRVAVLRITFVTCDFLFSFILYPAVNLKTIPHPACQYGICRYCLSIFIANSAIRNCHSASFLHF